MTSTTSIKEIQNKIKTIQYDLDNMYKMKYILKYISEHDYDVDCSDDDLEYDAINVAESMIEDLKDELSKIAGEISELVKYIGQNTQLSAGDLPG